MHPRPHSAPLSADQRKRVLTLACACDRLELQLLHQRREPEVVNSVLNSIGRFWPIVGLVGRLTTLGSKSSGPTWLRIARPLVSFFL